MMTLFEQQRIIKKLPAHLGSKRIHKMARHHQSHGEWTNLADLCVYLRCEVKVLATPFMIQMVRKEKLILGKPTAKIVQKECLSL